MLSRSEVAELRPRGHAWPSQSFLQKPNEEGWLEKVQSRVSFPHHLTGSYIKV